MGHIEQLQFSVAPMPSRACLFVRTSQQCVQCCFYVLMQTFNILSPSSIHPSNSLSEVKWRFSGLKGRIVRTWTFVILAWSH